MKNIYTLTLFMLLFSFSSAINAQELDFYNTQWLSDGTNGSNVSLSVDEGTTITVYSKAYEAGVTDAAGQGAGIECWIGFNSADTDPASWDESAWQVANFGQDNGNDDEYNYSTSSTAVGTHYIATRWRLDSGSYTYGGASATNGGAWDGVNNNNIGLTVNAVAQPLLITTSTCASATEVRLTGPWWGWNPAGGPIAADNGDGTWTFTFDPAPTDNMEYLLVVDGVQENLISIMANGGDCAPVTDYANYANRRWDVGSGNVTNTYGQCGSTCVAPVITLTGSDVTLNVGDTYTDDGATASDDEEGDISANIVVGGDTVDTATAGTYTITYDVSDGAGNAATQVTRTVNVLTPPQTTYPYCSSFDSDLGDWSTNLVSGTADWISGSGTNNGISALSGGGSALYYSGNYNSDSSTLISRPLDLTSLTAPKLTFQMVNPDWSGDQDVLEVWYKSSVSDAWTPLGSYSDATTSFVEITLDLPNPSSDYYVAFNATSGYGYGIMIDDVCIAEAPSCESPTDVAVSVITSTSANISWVSDGTSFNIEYGPGGFTQGSGTTDTSTTTSFSLSGLSSNTSYDVYVQTDCSGGGNGLSDWVGPLTFNTACDAYSTFPFTETFNSDSSSASCWTVDNANGDTDSWTTSYGSNTNEGDGVAAMYTDYNSGANDDWLISPGFQLTGNERLKFQQRVQSGNEPNDFEVLLSSTTAETASFTTVLLANAEYSNTAYQEIIIDLSSYTGVNYIAFHVANGGLDGWRLYIDDVVVEEIPSTPPGCAANFSNTLDASCGNFDFDISWDATDGADGYYITVGTTSGGSDIEASTDLGSATSYSFTNVQVATTYYYTVVPYNANGSATGCIEKSITTATTGCYCDSVPTSNDGSGISSVAFNGTDFTSGGDITYEDFTATAVEAGQSTTASLNITFATGYTYDTHVWVDLNDDYNFDSSELLFTGESSASNPTTLDASFLVPSDAPLGDHRVRIGTADSGQSTPNPCYSGSYGVTIDMTITVVAPPSCIGPSALTVSNLSDSSADISWTAGGTETDYEYVVQAAGTGEPTAAGTAVIGATSVSLTSLVDNYDYEVYVRSACAGGEFSSWTGPLSFTTEPAPIVPSYTNDFSTYPGEFWTEGTGALADGPSGTTSAWGVDGFGNNGTTGAAKVNVYYSSFSGGNDDWLISPMFDLSGGTYYLNLNVALTVWNSTSSTTFGAGDFVALMVTEDDGSTWSELYRWDANNTPSATGDAMPEIDLSSYTSMTKFALYAESATGNVDNDFFIDDFQITTTSLGLDDNSISSFNYFPNPVNDVLTIKAQNNVEDVKVFNMLGQMVLRQNPNTRDCTVDLSAMQTGAYFVQVSIGNTVQTVRVLKK